MTAAVLRRGAVRTVSARAASALTLLATPLFAYALLEYRVLVTLAVAVAIALFTVRWPGTATLLLMPVSLLGAAFGATPVSVGVLAGVTLVLVFRVMVGVVPLGPPHLWVGLLACLLLLGYAFPAVSTIAPTPRFFDLVGMLVGLGLLVGAIASPPDPRRLAQVIALTGVAAAAYVLVNADYVSERLQGFGQNPNYLGALLAVPIVAAVGLARRARRPWWLVPAAVCLYALGQTQSRGAFLAAAGGIAVVLAQGRSRRLRALMVIAALAIALVFPGSIDTIENVAAGDRKSTELTEDNAARRQVAEFAAQVATEHPLRGIGFGMFPPYAARDPRFGNYMATHNDYLELAAEDGVGTLAVFLVLLWLGTRSRRSEELATLRAVVLAYAVGLLFANPLGDLVVSLPFWLSLGCLLAGVPNARRSDRVDHKEGKDKTHV